jgi:hypothetical protein
VAVDIDRIGVSEAARATATVVGEALANVPAVVAAGLQMVDFLVRILANVIDEDARRRGIGVVSDPEWIAQAPRVRLLAVLAAGRDTGGAARSPRRVERVGRRGVAISVHSENLAEHPVLGSGVIVGTATLSRRADLAAAVASGDVQEAVLAKGHAAGVVIAAG